MSAIRAARLVPSQPIVPAVVWGATYIAARLLLGLELAPGARVAVAIAPVIPFVFALVGLVQWVRSMDELHRRVHLEALVIAFPLTVLLIMTLGLLDLAVGLSADDWSYRHLLPFLVIFYAFGIWRAWKRYL